MDATVKNPIKGGGNPQNRDQAGVAVSTAKKPELTVLQGVALIFGTNIGAGILSFPYAARNGGFLTLALGLLIAGTLTTFSMMYVAEVSLRTKEPLQLSGLAERYLGSAGKWVVFAAIMVNSLGALTAYATGSGQILHNLLHIPPTVGTLTFYVVGSLIIMKGLHATGIAEAAITTGMAVILAVLCSWTIVGPGIELANVMVFKPYFLIPMINLAVFTFTAQYVVPELARGLDASHKKAVPMALSWGMFAVGFTEAVVPFVALGLLGISVTEVVTIAWGDALGPVAFYMANLFGLLAMFTSFIAVGYTSMRNILDIGHWRQHGKYRPVALLLAVVPPLILSLGNLVGFVEGLSYAGGLAGATMAIVPVMLLHAARKNGNKDPEWVASWQASRFIQFVLIAVYVVAFLYSIASIFGFIPSAWAE